MQYCNALLLKVTFPNIDYYCTMVPPQYLFCLSYVLLSPSQIQKENTRTLTHSRLLQCQDRGP